MSDLTILGIKPTSLKDALAICTEISKSDMVPKEKRGKPMDCWLAMQYANEVGLKPLYGLQNIAVINGKPTLYGDALLALVKAHKDFVSCEEKIEGEGDNMIATCKITRENQPAVVSTFSVADAKLAKLWMKKGKFGDSPWVTYPKRMLQMRARGFAIRDSFPDALCGLISREEAEDYPQQPQEKNITPEPAKPSIEAKVEPCAPLPVDDNEHKQLLAFDNAAKERAIKRLMENPNKVENLIKQIKQNYVLSDDDANKLRGTANMYADEEAMGA